MVHDTARMPSFDQLGSCLTTTVLANHRKPTALQFHIHLNSEHSVNGRYFSAEFHIVHGLATEGAEGAEPFAVIGFMMESGSVLGYFDPTVDGAVPGWIAAAKVVTEACSLPDPDYFYEGTTKPDYFVNPYSLLPSGPQFFQVCLICWQRFTCLCPISSACRIRF
jgi:hypothetical protein